MSDNPKISITINNRNIVDSFDSFSAFMSMESISGGVSFTTTDFFPDKPKGWGIKLGDKITVKIDKEKILTGYIDEVELDESSDSNVITFSARDKTSDLIDCHYIEDDKEGSWENITNLGIIKRLCEPFNITVKYDKRLSSVLLKRPDKFTSDQATPIIDLILKVCKKIGILPVSIGDGNLNLTRATMYGFSIEQIDQSVVLSRNISYSDKDRFSEYISKGQSESDDTYTRLFGFTQISNAVPVKDDHFKNRYRPQMFLLDDSVTDETCKQNSLFEKNSRAGNSRVIEYTLQGFTSAKTGKVWKPNNVIVIDDPFLKRKDIMLISEVQFDVERSTGYTTTLKLVDRSTYSLSDNVKIDTNLG